MPRLDAAKQHRLPMLAMYLGVNALLVAVIAVLAQGVASVATGIFVSNSMASATTPSRIELHHAALERERQHQPAQHRPGIYALKDQGIPVAVLAANLDVSERNTQAAHNGQLAIAPPAMTAVAGFYTTAASPIEDIDRIATVAPNALPADVIAELLAPQAVNSVPSVEAAPVKTAKRIKKKKTANRGVASRGRLAADHQHPADAALALFAPAKSAKLVALNGPEAKKLRVRRDTAHDVLSRNMNAYAMAMINR